MPDLKVTFVRRKPVAQLGRSLGPPYNPQGHLERADLIQQRGQQRGQSQPRVAQQQLPFSKHTERALLQLRGREPVRINCNAAFQSSGKKPQLCEVRWGRSAHCITLIGAQHTLTIYSLTSHSPASKMCSFYIDWSNISLTPPSICYLYKAEYNKPALSCLAQFLAKLPY